MRAIKIDVEKKDIYEIDISEDWKEISKVLNCQYFDIVIPSLFGNNGDCLYIDDEGLLLEKPLGAFSITTYPQVLSGNGLILGTKGEGESDNAKIPLDLIKREVSFRFPQELPEPGFKFYSL